MSRRTHGRGPDFQAALVDALADLLAVDPDQVSIKLDAPGLEDLGGDLGLDLHLDAAGDAAPASPPEPSREPADVRDEEAPVRADESSEREADDDAGGAPEGDREETVLTAEDLDEEAEAAADFLEGLLDALDLPGDIRIRVVDDHAEVEVVEIGSGALIGRRGQTLESIQELVRCVLQREFQRRSRVKVDAEGYRARRLEKLIEKAEEAIDEVLDTGEPVRLEPMDVFERKSVHRIVAEVDGVMSRSQGREPARRVVIDVE